MRKNSPRINTTANDAVKRSTFIHGVCVNPRYTIFNWSFWTAIVLTLIAFTTNIEQSSKNIAKYLHSNSMSIVGVSVGAVGIILAAIAVVVIIYSRDDLSTIVAADHKTFESFIFPYRFNATLWGTLAIVSIMAEVTEVHLTGVFLTFGYSAWLWLFLYSILYSMYLIGEIIQQVILSSEILFRKNHSK